MALPSALDIIEKRESGGKNVPNYKYGPGFSASGHFQMIDSTWRQWAKAAGVDISQYPRAIDAPYDVQRRVAAKGFELEGFRPWEAVKHLRGQEKNYSALGDGGSAPGTPTPSPTYSATGNGAASPGATATPGPPITIEQLTSQLVAEYPQLRQTSGYRDPEHNKRVGGAKNSQHTHGRAADFSLKGLDEPTREAVIKRAIALGGRGLGYYPGSNSFHVDVRPGAGAFWGPNYSSSSLGQTPPYFQALAKTGIPAAAGGTQMAGVTPSSLPDGAPGTVPSAPAPPPDPLIASVQEAVTAITGPPQGEAPQASAPEAPIAPIAAPQPEPIVPPASGGAASLMAAVLDNQKARRIPGLLEGSFGESWTG